MIAEYPDKDRSYLSKVLAAMVSMGILMKLYRNLGYYRIIVEGITDDGRICLGSAGFMVDSYHK